MDVSKVLNEGIQSSPLVQRRLQDMLGTRVGDSPSKTPSAMQDEGSYSNAMPLCSIELSAEQFHLIGKPEYRSTQLCLMEKIITWLIGFEFQHAVSTSTTKKPLVIATEDIFSHISS